ncbi:MAG: hypothetical protein A3D24_02420 [Candidatus Blackburnbacteria bacterium RIFCSPHIGHO2_02_FULL_39_13]|uniref:ZIP zinc transporter n=1 Tax=Candidatus Blackburnbacteria bacterium RIFCSPLOWO2_01_FULL_40_20 TaxID=1797519 RepID=A0A1G1VAV9_9BACT|nr:MAG: hypothetical protein UT38_C0028G0003 [Microgenomates group bacterium GW2011_GWA2_39_19]OGY07603.1 MAG: hypothetical protein A2694_02760 [Candidatus Blackburnbacteria bacterium RIFCSPHIGHO2_01_FULL_40_17]OGY09536.1 MAG: hypothetical protein A3D24_02420 [Candidatus Blackburnbacteria bacterium RIFCSPHIGHO2_02_FULL_39_13]OGY12550.1 MAG: hypothetical protein A3A77_01090 [Candidatus Blackburnbacteria bacterium RIFCSPLOWO2_01_FULL_40_20]OGY15395.1 MAG: hypothetical protein A3I52_02930 [Candida
METILSVIGLTTLGSVAGLIGGIFLLSQEKLAKVLSIHAIPFAAGVMLAVSLLDILPEAIEGSNVRVVLQLVLLVVVVAFLFEQFLLHLHHHEGHVKTLKTSLPLVISGDTIHNFIDGLAIATAFLVDPKLGFVVAVATFLHELPHEMGDFGLMLAAGWKKPKIILVNLLSAMSTFLGAGVALLFSANFENSLVSLLAIAGGLFLYISLSDLLPEVQEEQKDIPWHQSSLFIGGVVLVWLMTTILPV